MLKNIERVKKGVNRKKNFNQTLMKKLNVLSNGISFAILTFYDRIKRLSTVIDL